MVSSLMRWIGVIWMKRAVRGYLGHTELPGLLQALSRISPSPVSGKFPFFLKHWGQKPHPLCILPCSSRQTQSHSSSLPFWFGVLILDPWASHHQRQNPPQYFFPESELLALARKSGPWWYPHTCVVLGNTWLYFDLKDSKRCKSWLDMWPLQVIILDNGDGYSLHSGSWSVCSPTD